MKKQFGQLVEWIKFVWSYKKDKGRQIYRLGVIV